MFLRAGCKEGPGTPGRSLEATCRGWISHKPLISQAYSRDPQGPFWLQRVMALDMSWIKYIFASWNEHHLWHYLYDRRCPVCQTFGKWVLKTQISNFLHYSQIHTCNVLKALFKCLCLFWTIGRRLGWVGSCKQRIFGLIRICIDSHFSSPSSLCVLRFKWIRRPIT